MGDRTELSFGDGQYGDHAQAFQASHAYQDQLVETYPPLAMPSAPSSKRPIAQRCPGLLRMDRVKVYRGTRQQNAILWETTRSNLLTDVPSFRR